ncbi:hypothetical protein EVAR_17759_1 [Eumeta japonica]|uniref:Uncharacterized protein n=1 Tax=Eumeta variegata TaxID=151549 RepID=A0A4C1TTE6_EUMVA|nr:hypothetical protein EVAR_17759_1 [Eumeta japonica]
MIETDLRAGKTARVAARARTRAIPNAPRVRGTLMHRCPARPLLVKNEMMMMHLDGGRSKGTSSSRVYRRSGHVGRQLPDAPHL